MTPLPRLLLRLALASLIVVVIVLAAGIYRFNFTNGDIYVQQEDGSVLHWDDSEGAREVMRTLFSVDTGQVWRLEVPEREARAVLTEIDTDGEPPYAAGRYEAGEERGEARLYYRYLQPLNLGDAEDEMYFVAPYTISNQGSGVFWYLGLFRFDTASYAIAQRDSLLLGDRIAFEGIAVEEPLEITGRLGVRLKEHGPQASLAEAPDSPRTLTLAVTAESLETLPEEDAS